MKKYFLALTVLFLGVAVYAKQPVATLVHNGNVRAFYGDSAFIKANAAAQSGDAITLSAGIFNGYTTITKNITLRGSGYTDSTVTQLNDYLTINIPSNDTVSHLHIEGIYFSSGINYRGASGNPVISKCKMRYINLYDDFNGNICNSLIYGIGLTSGYTGNVNLINSVFNVYYYSTAGIYYNQFNCTNCIIGGYFNGFRNSTFENCIFLSSTSLKYGSMSSNFIWTGNTLNYCLAKDVANGFLTYCNGQHNKLTSSAFANFFTNTITIDSNTGYIDILNTDPSSYTLTSTAQSMYKDANGSQIGIYGGWLPFSSQLSYPIINKMLVEKSSTTENHLDVDLQVRPAKQN